MPIYLRDSNRVFLADSVRIPCDLLHSLLHTREELDTLCIDKPSTHWTVPTLSCICFACKEVDWTGLPHQQLTADQVLESRTAWRNLQLRNRVGGSVNIAELQVWYVH